MINSVKIMSRNPKEPACSTYGGSGALLKALNLKLGLGQVFLHPLQVLGEELDLQGIFLHMT